MIDLSTVEAVIASGPYADTWESLSQAPVPAWFTDAKFGIFKIGRASCRERV